MPPPTVFISYSHKDEIWKDRLRPHLRMLEQAGRITIWDDRQIDAGATWYDEIKGAMENAAVAVCLISADYLASDFCNKEEIPYLLERRAHDGMLLLPILIRPCAWEAIDWLKAIQMLPRDGKSVAKDFRDDWDTPFTQIAKEILSSVDEPKRKALAPPIPRWSPPEKVDIGRLPITGAELFGRQKELELLDEAWNPQPPSDSLRSAGGEPAKVNVLSLVAWGGVGKSTLVNKWREQIAVDNYRGARRVFAWSFYSQGTSERVTSADLFIADALKWFGDADPSQGSPWDKGQRLADLVRREKTLLLLDGMEPLQSSLDFERGKVNDPALATLIAELARENPGLCVITTRENVADLAPFPTTTRQRDLEQISAEAGRALLRVGGVQGTDAELEQAARDFGLHALALNLLAAYLHEIPGHHISHASEIPDLDVPLAEGKHPRRVMAAFAARFGDSAEVDLLRILGLFNSPADKDALAAVRAAPPIPNLTEHLQPFDSAQGRLLSDAEWLQLISRLRRVKLIAPESRHRPDTLDAHPLVREHFGKQLKQEYPAAWREGNSRLYEYYRSHAKEFPDTIQEMAPLFAAVMHGCQAGKHQEALDEVYWKRILRSVGQMYSVSQLGAIGASLSAASGFFDQTWWQPVAVLGESQRSHLFALVGFYLRALGRMTEATQPMQAALEAYISQGDWVNASRQTNNLSELYLILGDVKQALTYAEQSVELADRSGDGFNQEVCRAALANALHQEGRLSEAEISFIEVEEMQKKRQPQFPFLLSLRGFHYCDLLLSQGKYQEVSNRASQTLELAKEYLGKGLGLHDIGNDFVSLGRAYLLQSQREANHPFTESLTYLNRAVDGLRQAGMQDYLPRGLLARAEFYRATGALEMAQKDLDEAFSIATRGGMRLHEADCHLEYARLWLTRRPSPQPSPWEGEGAAREHLAIAKKMIVEIGYHRRDGEVKELEARLL